MARSPATRRSRSRSRRARRRLIILPTGHACATQTPPVGAVANALHALTLLIARQLVSELESLDPDIEYFVVPPLCPLVGSPYDFSRTSDHIERAIRTTDAWLAQHGLEQGSDSPRDAAAQSLSSYGPASGYAALQNVDLLGRITSCGLTVPDSYIVFALPLVTSMIGSGPDIVWRLLTRWFGLKLAVDRQ